MSESVAYAVEYLLSEHVWTMIHPFPLNTMQSRELEINLLYTSLRQIVGLRLQRKSCFFCSYALLWLVHVSVFG